MLDQPDPLVQVDIPRINSKLEYWMRDQNRHLRLVMSVDAGTDAVIIRGIDLAFY